VQKEREAQRDEEEVDMENIKSTNTATNGAKTAKRSAVLSRAWIRGQSNNDVPETASKSRLRRLRERLLPCISSE